MSRKWNRPLIVVSASVAASIGSLFIEFLPHTFGKDVYRKYVQKYTLGKEEGLNNDTKILFNQVLDDLKIDEKDKKYYHPFRVIGFHLFQAGIANKTFGSIIGIPTHYTYKTKFDINVKQITLGFEQQYLNIYHPAAEDLLESLVLSDKAKKFGIAREILMNQKQLPVYYSLESPIMISATVFATEWARLKFDFHKKPIPIRLGFYGISAIVGFVMWFQIRDILRTYFEKKVDKELSKLGTEYIEGGKEFYDKLLMRNVALRKLLGIQGPKLFNKDGDEIRFIRQKTVPISQRKKFFNEITFHNTEETA